MPTPPVTRQILDREFLEIRAKLIDLAATLDRIERPPGPPGDDPRIAKILGAIQILADKKPDRAERIQMLFSLPYDEI